MIKDKDCEALRGVGHSIECVVEHDVAAHSGAGNRHPDARYKGYILESLSAGASEDEKHAWCEGYNSREPHTPHDNAALIKLPVEAEATIDIFHITEWWTKTEWFRKDRLSYKYLGWHLADAMKDVIERQRSQIAQLEAENSRLSKLVNKAYELTKTTADFAKTFADKSETHKSLHELVPTFRELEQIMLDASEKLRKDDDHV